MNKIFFKKVKKFILIRDIFNICNYTQKKIYNLKIFGVNNIKDAISGDVTFFNDMKYEYDVKITKASACIVNKKLVKEYNQISETGWYTKMYAIMVSIAGSAVRQKYNITAQEITTLCKEIDFENGNWYKSRPFDKEADRAIEFVYGNL